MSAALERLTELTKKINELEASFDHMFEFLPEPMCIASDQNVFLKVNPAWVEVLGYTTEELEGHNYLEFVHPEDLESTITAASGLKTSSVSNFKNRYKHKDGHWVDLSWSAAKYADHGCTFAVARAL